MVDLSKFFCPFSDCRDFGAINRGNITTSTRYGKNKTVLLRCKTCDRRFSENRNTIFLNSNFNKETIQLIIKTIAEGNSIRGTARTHSLDKDAVNRVVIKAGEHCKAILQGLIRDLNLKESQLDDLWTFIKKRKLFSNTDEKDSGGE